MNVRKRVTQVGMLALAISIVTVLAFATGQVRPESAQAVAGGPAMSLGAPGTVFMGVTFQVTVNADPSPDVEISAFGSEVLFRDPNGVLTDGLKWQPRAECFVSEEDVDEGTPPGEVQVEPPSGTLGLCQAGLSTLLGGARHAVISNIDVPPLDPFDVAPNSTTTLVELDFVCNTPGSYTLTLTAGLDSPDGAVFANLSATEIPVKTVEGTYDADGDGTPETHQVADTLTIECTDEPPPTATPPPTDVPPATDTPQDQDTPAPTDVSPAADTPEPTSAVGAVSAGFGPIDGDGGVSAGLWAVIGALLAAAATGLIILGWPKHARATVSAALATPGPALPVTTRVGSGTNFGPWPIVGAVVATGLALFGWKFTRRGR